MEEKKKGKREGEKHGVGDKWFELDTLMKGREIQSTDSQRMDFSERDHLMPRSGCVTRWTTL